MKKRANKIIIAFVLFVIALIIFSLFRVLISIARSKRIEEFAITSTSESITFEQRLYKAVYFLSDFIF